MSSDLVPLDSERYVAMNSVVEEHLKGRNPTVIARALKMNRADVVGYINDWREIVQNDPNTQAYARESLYAMRKHYDMIIDELWSVVGTTDDKTKVTALKSIADIDAKRQEALQKAGMYDDAVLGDEVAKVEQQIEQIKKLLRDVIGNYPNTKQFILKGLSEIAGQAVGVEVEPPLEGELVN